MTLIDSCAAEHKTETAAIADLQTIIKGVSSELGDKVVEVQRLDKQIRDCQAQQVRYITFIVTYLFQ